MDSLIRDATPSLPVARIAVPGQSTSVAAPYLARQLSLIASRCFVNAKVVPLPSWRTTVAIVRFGSFTPGLARAITGSLHDLICPRKIPAYACRDSFNAGTPGRLYASATLPAVNGRSSAPLGTI